MAGKDPIDAQLSWLARDGIWTHWTATGVELPAVVTALDPLLHQTCHKREESLCADKNPEWQMFYLATYDPELTELQATSLSIAYDLLFLRAS